MEEHEVPLSMLLQILIDDLTELLSRHTAFASQRVAKRNRAKDIGREGVDELTELNGRLFASCINVLGQAIKSMVY